MAITDKDREIMTKSDQDKLTLLTGNWEYYNNTGDIANRDATKAQADALRGTYGYSADSNGIYRGAIVKTNPSKDDRVKSTQSPSYTQSPEIQALYNAKKQTAVNQLKAAIEKQVSGYHEERLGLNSKYDPLRAQSEVERYKSAQALRENLANTGELSGGQGRQDTLNLQNSYAAQLGNLNRQQQAQDDSLSRAITDARGNGELQQALLNQQYDAEMMQALLSDRYRFEDNQYRDKVFNQDVLESNRNFALNEAGVTGMYKNQHTLQKVESDRDFKTKEDARLTANAMALLEKGITSQQLASFLGISLEAAQGYVENYKAMEAEKLNSAKLSNSGATLENDLMNQKLNTPFAFQAETGLSREQATAVLDDPAVKNVFSLHKGGKYTNEQALNAIDSMGFPGNYQLFLRRNLGISDADYGAWKTKYKR